MITVLGKVAVTPRGAWSASVANYEYLDTVTDSGNTYTVINKSGLVPAGTPLTNTTYYELTAAKGAQGDKAWQPVHANIDDGVRTVQQLVDYVGGTGTKPTANIGSYVSTTGYTTVIANAKDIRGTAGLAGASKIPAWLAQVYASGASVSYLGKYWTSNAATAATDLPGTSIKWIEDLSAYLDSSKVSLDKGNYTGVDPDLYTSTAFQVNKQINGTTGALETVTTNDISDWIKITPGKTYKLYRSDGGSISPSTWVYSASKTNGRRLYPTATYPTATPIASIQFTAGVGEEYLLTYVRLSSMTAMQTNINDKLVIVEVVANENDFTFNLNGKSVTGRELVLRNIEAIKAGLPLGGIQIGEGSYNVYDRQNEMIGYSYLNGYPNANASYNLSNWIPVEYGKTYKIKRSDGGTFSPSINAYDKDKLNFRRIVSATDYPTTTLINELVYTPLAAERFILIYTKYLTNFNPVNINSLLVVEVQNDLAKDDIRISVNGKSTTASAIVQSQMAAIIEVVGKQEEEYNPAIGAYPFITIPDEFAATDVNAPIQVPPNWTYQDIIKNVTEVMRTNNPDYISLIGDFNQTTFPDLPAKSIGLSNGSGSQTRYPLYLYDFKPKNYEQTVILFAAEHGDECEATIATLRMMQYICNQWRQYPQLSYLRHKVRFLVCPVVSPWGYMNDNRNDAVGINNNRNWDYNWDGLDNTTYEGTNSYVGIGSTQMTGEIAILMNALKPYLKEVDFGFSAHSGTPTEAYWFTCPPDSVNRPVVETVSKWLATKNNVSFPSQFRGLDEAGLAGTSVNYFARVLNIPFLTMDYCIPKWGTRYGVKAMTIYLEEIMNMAIAHVYAKLQANATSTVGELFKSRRIGAPISFEYGHIYNASAPMIGRIYDALVTSFPTRVKKSVIGKSLGNTYDLLAYEISPVNPKRTVIVIGGTKTKVSQANLHAATRNYTDGLRHVMVLPTILDDLLRNTDDEVLAGIRENVRVVVVPIANPDDAYGAVNTIDISSMFGTDTHLAGFSGRPECLAIEQLIKSYDNASLVTFDEINTPTTNVKFTLNSGFPYEYHVGNFGVREYVEKFLPEQDFTVTVVKDETGTAPNNSLLNWAYFGAGCNGVEINFDTMPTLSPKEWDVQQVTVLMNIFINILSRI